MPTLRRKRIESDIAQLSIADQRGLMERPAQRIRRQTLRPPVVLESDLAAMAADPAMHWTNRAHDAYLTSDQFYAIIFS